MKCNICGNQIIDNITFCPYCGSAVKKETNNLNTVNTSESEQNNIGVNTLENQAENENIKVELPEKSNNVESSNIEMPAAETFNEQSNVEVPIDINNVNTAEQSINNNYNSNNMYNMQNYQPMNEQYGMNSQTMYNQNNYQYNMNGNQVEDRTNIWLAILSWLIPLVGIILFFTMKKSSKKTSKACGIAALISILLSSAVLSIGIISFKNIFGHLIEIGSTEEYENDYDDYDYEDDYTSNNENTSDNIWESYKVTINGKEIKLPCSYNEFVNVSNYRLKSDVETATIKDNHYNIVNVYKDNSVAAIVNIYNRTGADALYKDSEVSSIDQSLYYIKNNKVEAIIFPGELYVGKKMTKDEVITLLGKPAKETFNEYSSSKRYNLKYTTKESYTTSNYYEIIIVDDVIQELKLDNRS